MTGAPDVSVIVPLHRLTPAARECLEGVLALPGDRHELLVVVDRVPDGLPDRARVIETGAATDTSPAEKRDLAASHARGRLLAFLDDDACPAPDWIERGLAVFESDPGIAAAGGPGLTPPQSGLLERAGGAFYESRLGSGGLRYRFVADGPRRDVDDYPAYNFWMRAEALQAVGGWSSKFYGGEDTKLCLALVEGGHRIVYDPDLVVFHHRRPLFRPHMRQVGNVGRHRGWFVRAYPRTSARPFYFLPSVALLGGLAGGAWALREPRRRAAGAAAVLAGSGVIAAGARREGYDWAVAALLPLALAAGHGAYGAMFLRGLLFTREIEAM